MTAKRTLRPRTQSQYASQREWGMDDTDEDDFILARRYSVEDKFRDYGLKSSCGLVQEMSGEDFTLQYVQKNGLTSPIVFKDTAGLGMKLPSSNFTVSDVKRLVGPRRQVDVMDTLTQQVITMTMHQWTKYYESVTKKRKLNVISLEFSCTKLAEFVEPPHVVHQLDWVEWVWPKDLRLAQTDPTNDMRRMMYPKVQKYCLMSVAGCFTDFHLDFGGTSVWYHLIRGEKHFILVPPSKIAYEMFKLWQLSGEQEGVFFADLVEHAQLIRLTAGDTFIMPSGWIHAVYTPSDSLVFGGNFLHSFNIPQQLAVADMEVRTKVPSKFRYPFYGIIHWYTLHMYCKQLELSGVTSSDEGRAPEDKSVITSLESDVQLTKGTRWLKEVSVERVPVFSSSQEKTSDEHLPDDVPLDDDSTDKRLSREPCISSIEREGLLALIKRMKDEELFRLDTPPGLVVSATDFLTQLTSLLQSHSLGQLCSSQPTGVSLLHGREERIETITQPTSIPLLHGRGEQIGVNRKRKQSESPSPGKQVRLSCSPIPSTEKGSISCVPGHAAEQEKENKHVDPLQTELSDLPADIFHVEETDNSFIFNNETPPKSPSRVNVQTSPLVESPFLVRPPSTPSQPHSPLSTPTHGQTPCSTSSQTDSSLSTAYSTFSTPSQIEIVYSPSVWGQSAPIACQAANIAVSALPLSPPGGEHSITVIVNPGPDTPVHSQD